MIARLRAHDFGLGRAGRISGWPLWVLGAWLVTLVVFLAWPAPLPAKLAAVVTGICPQRPSHAILLGGTLPAMEARMSGLFGGFLAGWLVSWLTGRGLARGIGRFWVWPVAIGGILLMAIDGANAFAWDLRLLTLYPPRNDLRLATGLLAGYGLSLFLTPILAPVLWHRPAGRVMVRGIWDLAPGLIAIIAFGAAAVSGSAAAYYPVAVIGVAGVVALLACLNAAVVLVATGRAGRIDRPGILTGWLGVAAGLAAMELAGLALLRVWATGAFGLRWESL